MRKIVYYVASSLDGYISGPNHDTSGFVPYEDVVAKYQADLTRYDTVIMGRRTYEYGYLYGLEPGQPAYPHMQHYIFSKSLRFKEQHEQVHVCLLERRKIIELKNQEGTDIYLCGGGALAGWLLDEHLIDNLKIKLNPFIQGKGVRLFGSSDMRHRLQLVNREGFPDGLQILEYEVFYSVK